MTNKNPADSVSVVDIGILAEADQNSRVHSDEQIAQIAASMEKFGWTIPALVDENYVLIAGHARYRAALLLGYTKAPVMIATDWSDAKKEAYQIADNRLSETSTWDTDILENQIKRLNAAEFDMTFMDMDDFNIELFKPALTPMTDTNPITDAGLAKTKDKMNKVFEGNPEAQDYEIVCPYCSKDFTVEI